MNKRFIHARALALLRFRYETGSFVPVTNAEDQGAVDEDLGSGTRLGGGREASK
jgi:hypothetical protein